MERSGGGISVMALLRFGIEAADGILKASKSYMSTLEIGLFKDSTFPPTWQVLASYTQPTFSSYGLLSLGWPNPPTGPSGLRRIESAPASWLALPGDPQEFAVGYFLYDPLATVVVAAIIPDNTPQPCVTIDYPFQVVVRLAQSYIVF
jgi:hypothetical protein